MRFEILCPQEPHLAGDVLEKTLRALAQPQQWRWRIVDERGQVLAGSDDLPSRADCDYAFNRLEAGFKGDDVFKVDVPPAQHPCGF